MRFPLTTALLCACVPFFAACSGGGSSGGAGSMPGFAAPAAVAPIGGPGRAASPFPMPSGTGTPGPTAPPSPTASPGGPQEAFGVGCTHFRSNPMCAGLPATPAVSAQSALWADEQRQPGTAMRFAGLHVMLPPAFGDTFDSSEPTYMLPSGSGIAHVLNCGGFSWSIWACERAHLQGATVFVPAGSYPEGSLDRHLAWNDDANRREIDLFGASRPDDRSGSPLDVGAAGQCAYDGDGTNCSMSTATNIATSLGTIDPTLVAAAESDPHGSLPYAISASALCADRSFVYPATASDGGNTDGFPACAGRTAPGMRPPEGVRFFLDLGDAQIDATTNAPYVKVILRTLDREHFGGVITDTNWYGATGLAFQFMRGGWTTIARSEAGVTGQGDATLPITTDGIDVRSALTFCSNGTC